MATQHRQQLSRLAIPPMQQQPMGFEQPMFSPALPTSIQYGFPPPMTGMPLQTPMQQFFNPPAAPGRPSYASHKGQPSLAQFIPHGMQPPSAIPMTPLGQNGFPPMMMGGGHPFATFPRGRRQPSISLGGPPKAPLGGPNRKTSPLPPPANPPAAVTTVTKSKKIVVNFPQETIPGENGEPATRPSWAREPLHPDSLPNEPEVLPPELTTAEPLFLDGWRYHTPNTLEVFLPGKVAWDDIRQRLIDEKLEKLGVERGLGSNVPHIHAPHARAASVSSPADPALLYFRLNKLQQAQASASNSLSTSPQPPATLSPSPNMGLAPRFLNRHGHSMSLAQPPSLQPAPFNPVAAYNPFGPDATLGSDQIIQPSSELITPEPIHAPQGRVPVTVSSLAPPLSVSRPTSRPDFMLGFGVDIPEEEEPPEEEAAEVPEEGQSFATEDADASREDNAQEPEEPEVEEQNEMLPAGSSSHSRHISRLSAALSLRAVGGTSSRILNIAPEMVPIRSPVGNPEVDDLDKDAVGEWTGSEDMHLAEDMSDDEESIGEWSNPSDEERARQQRVERRLLRRSKHEIQVPRRLPNFPRPPENTFVLPLPRDDDIISNPSEEGHVEQERYLGVVEADNFYAASPNSGRPLPPLPHSRNGSDHFSTYDPARAHSRAASELQAQGQNASSSSTTLPRRNSLNPFAQPFVFGVRQSGSWSSSNVAQAAPAPVESVSLGHARGPSIGKPLNVAAPEFKPGGFTFRPPPGVPQLTFPPPEPARPLPLPPVEASPARAHQGREKRQRRGSSSSYDEDEANLSNMTSFRFPAVAESPQNRRSAPTTPRLSANRRQSSLNASAQPFTFSGFSSSLPFIARDANQPHSMIANAGSPPQELEDENTARAEEDAQVESPESMEGDLPLPAAGTKLKRAPIPLDFKHPVSKNTVPAGLFKALINGGDERTRRTVRSRLSSHDIFEHANRPSLDDLIVPSISHKTSRGRLVTDPVLRNSLDSPDDLFSPQRRSSLPPALHSAADSSLSGVSIPAVNLTRQLEIHEYERRLRDLLDDKIDGLRRDLLESREAAGNQSMSASTEAMITEVVSLFRTQLQESAARGLDDSQIDARGELDFELIKDVVHQGHAESRALLQQQLGTMVERLEHANPFSETLNTVMPFIEQQSGRMINAVLGAMSQIGMRLESIEKSPGLDRGALVHELSGVLAPVLNTLRPEPVDYDALTDQLTQAVKPHISQLIDLASDKRETAGLIVDRLMPLLPSLLPVTPGLDSDALIARLTSEVRKIIAPIDAFEIKEQVADLVVERLDSRLAVRDRTLNAEVMTGKITDSVNNLLSPLQGVSGKVESLVESQQALQKETQGLASVHKDVVTLLSDLPSQLAQATEALADAKKDVLSRPASSSAPAISSIELTVTELAAGQKALSSQNGDMLLLHQETLARINALPEAMSVATSVLQAAHSDFMSSRDILKQEADEIRRLKATNTEIQVQLAKARGAHGQVRVEKEVYSEKLKVAEEERDQLRAQIEEAQSSATSKATESAVLEQKNAELQEALSQALARLKSSDVAAQASQEKISQLEKANRDLSVEKQALKAKVDALELQATFSVREKDTITQSLANLQREHDHLVSQQSHWDDLRQTSEKIELLTTLIGQADNEEMKELRRVRDRSRTLESEHAALQRRFKDQETKATNSERTAAAARQSLVQAQQRASEWEKRAKEYEGELELVTTKLDHAEQAHSQLDADFSFAKLQLEEREADDRLTKDRENKLRDKVAALEARVSHLQTEIERVKKPAVPVIPSTPVSHRKIENGISHPARPDSRASTVYLENRSVTPVAQMNGHTRAASRSSTLRSNTPPASSVWDSMHAPKRYPNLGPAATPKTPRRRPQQYYPSSIPSPTPSTVSLAPTQGDDGWWS